MYWLGSFMLATVFLVAGSAQGLSDPADDGQVRIEEQGQAPIAVERDSRIEIEDGDDVIEIERENGEVEVEREGKVERGLEKAGRATGKGLNTAGKAVGKGLEKAGEGMNRAGEWVQDRLD